MSPISILLVDDNPVFLETVERFINEHGRPEMDVVAHAGGGYEALTSAKALRPQVVLVDLVMPDLPGLVLIPRLRKMLPDTGLIVLSMMDTEGYRVAASASGADGFVSKSEIFSDLVPAIQRVAHVRSGDRKR